MIHRKDSEYGQAIYLIGFALVAMLGVMALAIDGGRVYADRRKAQNTADTASFAGGLVIAQADKGDPTNLPAGTFTQASAKAFERAISNRYNDSNPYVDVSVSIPETPLFEDGSYYYLVRVEITSRLDGMFTSLVYQGQLANTVYAVAKVNPIQGLAFGNSLYANAPDECNAMHFTGTVDVRIVDGGIFSNSNADENNCPSMHRRGDGDVEVANGGIGSVGSFRNSGSSGSITPPPDTGLLQESLPDLPVPDCGGLTDFGSVVINPGTMVALEPGIYDGIEIRGASGNPTNVTMKSGMYCITNDGFEVSGATVFGKDVFFYMGGGDFLVTASSFVHLSAATNLYDASSNNWSGMLVYMPISNHGTVTITGTSGSYFGGTIYAPGPVSPSSKAKCTVIGTGEVLTLNSQIICYTIEIGGDGKINMRYDANANFKLGSKMSQQE